MKLQNVLNSLSFPDHTWGRKCVKSERKGQKEGRDRKERRNEKMEGKEKKKNGRGD